MPEYFHKFTPPEDAVAPQDVRILSAAASPFSNPQKIRITVQLTPFRELPDLNFSIVDAQGVEVSSVSMIESVLNEISFVMHLRKAKGALAGTYSLHMDVLYRDIGVVDQTSLSFTI